MLYRITPLPPTVHPIPILPAASLCQDRQPPEMLTSLSSHVFLSIAISSYGLGHMQHQSTWLGLISGRKLWYMAPANAPQPEDPDCNDLENSAKNARRDGVTLQLQLPGQIIYFPDSYWHATCNLGDFTVGLGATSFLPNFEGKFPTISEGRDRGLPDEWGILTRQI